MIWRKLLIGARMRILRRCLGDLALAFGGTMEVLSPYHPMPALFNARKAAPTGVV